MSTLAGYGAALYAASGTSTAFTNEAMTDSGDHITYTITNAAKRYWDDAVAVVIQESTDSGSTWHAAPANTQIFPGGKVNFGTARSAGNQYRAQTGNYFTITTIGGGHEWDAQIDADLLDATEFGAGWKTFIPGEKGGSASIMRFWIDTYFSDLLLTGNVRAILALYVSSSSGARYEGYAFIKQYQLKTDIKALVDTTVQFTLDKTFYYNPGP